MNTEFHLVERFPEPTFSAVQQEVFAGLELQSRQLAEVLAAESATRAAAEKAAAGARALRIGAFSGDTLIGWTYGWVERERHFYMAHSGVIPAARRKGVYSELVRRVLEHCHLQGYTTVESRHVTLNNSVLIAKLKLGFQVSGFTYSEVYGPLVHLTYLLGEGRRALYRVRAAPLRPSDSNDA